MTSFREALQPLRERFRDRPIEREVFRVFGRLNKGTSIEAIRREVLAWAKNRAGDLPSAAWDGESFERLVGGRTCIGCRVKLDDADIWALRLDDPDETVAKRTWSTECTLWQPVGEKPRVGVRQLITAPGQAPEFAPHVPGFLRQIAEKHGFSRTGRPIEAVSSPVEAGAEDLLALLLNPARRIPVVAVSTDERSGRPLLDNVEGLARAVLGLAHVFVLQPEHSWALTRQLEKRLSVFGGAVRIYDPGFYEADDPFRHPLFLANRLQDPEHHDLCIFKIREHCAQLSIRMVQMGTDLVRYEDLRRAERDLERRRLRASGGDLSQAVGRAEEEIHELQRRLNEAGLEQDYYAAEHDAAVQRAQAAGARALAAQRRIDMLTAALASAGADREGGAMLPQTWGDFLQWCDEMLVTRVGLTPAARREVRSPQFADPQQAARCLLWLVGPYRDARMNGGPAAHPNARVEDGLLNAPCGGDSFDDVVRIDRHIKNGGTTPDPTRCLRICHGWDDVRQTVIVAHMPSHRVTGAT